MVKLTSDLIERAHSFINAINDRELDLKSYKIAVIENLGASKDAQDCINFTNNDLRHLGNFPLFRRLRTLLLANNRISSMDANLAQMLPNLETLVLTNNHFASLVELEPLKECRSLTLLSLLENPVTKQQHYRLWVIWRVPSLRTLDFKRVSLAERKEAAALFSLSGKDMTPLAISILEQGGGRTAETAAAKAPGAVSKLSAAEQAKVREAIEKASSLDEITHLESLLQAKGPSQPLALPSASPDDAEEAETE